MGFVAHSAEMHHHFGSSQQVMNLFERREIGPYVPFAVIQASGILNDVGGYEFAAEL